jgi:hypothetical protein
MIRAAWEGRWSRQRFLAYEGIRDELDAYAKLVIAGRLGQAHESAIRILRRPDAQPTRLVDLSLAMVLSLQERQDADLARALADRAVRETSALDFGLLLDVVFTLSFAADSSGSVRAARRALELCRSVQSACERERDNLERSEKCSTELALLTNEPMPGLPRWIARPMKNTPPECDLSQPGSQP